MWRAALAILLVCSGCGVAPQPESNRTVAAFEIPLSTEGERHEMLALLSQEAAAYGYHVDASNAEELKQLSEVSPMTIHAAVWRGKNDEESIASIMDHEDHLGRAWLTFAKGQRPERSAEFREKVMQRIKRRWPKTLSLPIMPSGGIPNPYQLRRTDDGYKLNPEYASNYQVSVDSPQVAHD